jgi:hypothetical protein
MSKGSRIVGIRVEADLEAAIETAIASANYHSRIEPHTLSSWIKAAIREKLAHIQRSKRKGKKNDGANARNAERAGNNAEPVALHQ